MAQQLAAGNQRSDTSISCAREAMDTICKISEMLGTGLDRDTLLILTRLCELGVNPEALAAVVKDLKASQSPFPSNI